jgi:AmiR/NasT family two-component response regulator
VLGHTTSNDELSDALSTRKVIGHAVGIVMERYRLDEQRAFAFLIRSSQQRETRLEIIANEIVSDVERAVDAEAPGDAA